MKQLVFFNNKGGVGKTTFIQHLGYALEKQGKRVLFIDADPQCNLTAYICTDEQIDDFWKSKSSIYNVVLPLISGTGDIDKDNVVPYQIPDRNLWLLPGDVALSEFEQTLAENWTAALAGREIGFRVTSAIFRYINNWAEANKIDYVLLDIGPNLGALNRAVLLGCDYFIIPLVPDLFSLRGLTNIGQSFVKWMNEWSGAVSRFEKKTFKVQNGRPAFAGYVTAHFNTYRRQPARAWERWNAEIPARIKRDIVDQLARVDKNLIVPLNGGYNIGDMKNYHSLVPLSQAKLKPIFELTAVDGAFGAHISYVRECGRTYTEIAQKVCRKLKT